MPKRYQALLQERAELVAEARRAFESAEKDARDLTDAERTRDDEIAARLDVIASELQREERRREWERSVEAVAKPNAGTSVTLPGEIARILDAQDQPFESLAEQLLAVRQAALPGGYVDLRLRAQLGHNVGIPAEGGFLLHPQYAAGIWQRVYESGAIMNRTFKIPIGTDADSVLVNALAENSRVTGNRWGGLQAYWVQEAGNPTASQTQFRQMRFSPHKLAVLTYATSEMLRNPATLEGVINQLVPQEIAWQTENAFVNGIGGGQPIGILQSAALIAVAPEALQAAATIVSENISNMWAQMWAKSRPNAVWLINQDCEPQLDQLSLQVGVGGVPTYMPPGGLADAPYGRLKGRPVIAVEYCPTLGTQGDIILADWSQYGMSDRGSIRSESSIHVQFLTDQMAYRFIYEVDGQSLWNAPLTPAQGANQLSPFVTLQARP
ncbi:MAG: phage major capsid protein [Chloroflexi bacterium]|nr:phage major capsid protein [Chloroflexota bacterium]